MKARKEKGSMTRENVAKIGEDSPLALQILDYFRRHPQAKDSVEGIARFWVDADPVDVSQALEKLVELDLISKRKNAAMDLYGTGVDKKSA